MSLIRYIGLFLFSMMTGFCGLGVKNKSEVKFFLSLFLRRSIGYKICCVFRNCRGCFFMIFK